MSRRFKQWRIPTFDHRGLTEWNWMCQHPESLTLGRCVDIGAFTYINAKYGVTIEDHAQVGSHCSIYSLSTIDNKKGHVLIRTNARLGSHTVVMPGVTIGENSIVGACSFVDKHIADNVLAAGVPVRILRELTPEEMKVEGPADEDR
jgi:acetyltransferase-like isoleucine patch superfamily enzyme